jgi:isopentenyl-diphosphate delta-isomerase
VAPADADHVVLVDEQDHELGTLSKLEAHETGQRHRAVSVFIFDGGNRVLLQRRADGKYHSAGQWSNTCCGHPRPGESPVDAARRRLAEEMGLDCPLEHVVTFTYRADVGGGLTEHEIDHVFSGHATVEPNVDPGEVGAWRWASAADIERELRVQPETFTPWFRPAWDALHGRR